MMFVQNSQIRKICFFTLLFRKNKRQILVTAAVHQRRKDYGISSRIRTTHQLLRYCIYTVKKAFRYSRPPSGMSLSKLSLGGNNYDIYKLFPPRESLVSDIPAGDWNIEKIFLRCRQRVAIKTEQKSIDNLFSCLFL
jgi:hypothetical protein